MPATITRLPSASPLRKRAAQQARGPSPALTGTATVLPSRVHFWRGASGQRHLCTVYSLIDCPPLPKAVYMLVRREADGRRVIVGIGALEHEHAPLNLACVRHAGANASANEIHVSFAPSDPAGRLGLRDDIAAANPSYA